MGLVLMLTNLLLLLPAASVVCGNIDQGLLEAADGEIAMKNLEAAQVKMEEKLNSLTSFIDQELEKEKDSPMSKGYARRKRETQESNPLLDLPQNTVKEMIVSMKALNSAFDNLQKAYEQYKSNMAQEKVIMEEIEQPEEPVSPAEDPEEYPSAPTETLRITPQPQLIMLRITPQPRLIMLRITPPPQLIMLRITPHLLLIILMNTPCRPTNSPKILRENPSKLVNSRMTLQNLKAR